MSNQEILEKAIKKAIAGGWEMPEWAQGPMHLAYSKLEVGNEYSLIFNHGFARALWGDTLVGRDNGMTEDEMSAAGMLRGKVVKAHILQPFWQYHLQMMVISDDPVQYLGEHI